MALHRQDLEAVMPDLPRAKDTLRRGLRNMRHIGSSRDVKVRHSATFLQKLTRAALSRHAKVCYFGLFVHIPNGCLYLAADEIGEILSACK